MVKISQKLLPKLHSKILLDSCNLCGCTKIRTEHCHKHFKSSDDTSYEEQCK